MERDVKQKLNIGQVHILDDEHEVMLLDQTPLGLICQVQDIEGGEKWSVMCCRLEQKEKENPGPCDIQVIPVGDPERGITINVGSRRAQLLNRADKGAIAIVGMGAMGNAALATHLAEKNIQVVSVDDDAEFSKDRLHGIISEDNVVRYTRAYSAMPELAVYGAEKKQVGECKGRHQYVNIDGAWICRHEDCKKKL